ncbi:MAG: SEL1-like repeat protein [Bacteroidaceae bacterium]|nr:SEL1-like repeat protein [Bacteroidaceae bacterium]
MLRRILHIIILLFIATATFAQSPLDTLAMRAIMINQLFPQERVYLHFDNTAYYLGETMWFKAYATSGLADNEKPISKVLYVELCAPEGYVVETKKYKLDENGRCNGEFELKPSLLSGYYEVRAYTRYMLNWGDEAVFSRVFPIYDKVNGDNYDFKNMLDRKRSFMYRGEWMTNKLPEADLKFYPEGGHLVEGIETTIAYELKSYDGVHGADTITILADGEPILRTSPTLLGMGSFRLLPKKDVKYRAEVEITRHKNGKRKTFKFDLPKVEKEGASLSVVKADGNINVTIKNNFPATANLGCVIVNNGYILSYDAFTSDEKEKKIQMPLRNLAEGVNRVVLFADSVPLAERQFFVTHDTIAAGDISTVKLTAKVNGRNPKDIILQPHEKMTLTIEREDGKAIAPDAEFSLSVSDIDHRQKMSYEHNMYTHTLLGSQLKGYIPDAARYFDHENPQREEELDLLMLTHGWTSYDWSKLSRSHIDVRHQAEVGIELSGEVYTREANKKWGQLGTYLLYPLKLGTMNFKFMSDSIHYKFHTTRNGRFRLRSEDFYGDRIAELSARYIPFKPKNAKGIRFVLDRYFSPGFRFFDYWERTPGEAKNYTPGQDTTVIQKDLLSYQLAEIDIVEDKKKDKRSRPPRSEIKFNFVDEWEYAQDVTYFNLQRDFDTTKVEVSLDFANINNLGPDKRSSAIETTYKDGIKPVKEAGDDDIYNVVGDLYFYTISNSLTSAQVLRSIFWRHNFNWAYYVQSIVVDGEYNSDSVPEYNFSYIRQRPYPTPTEFTKSIAHMMNFKEVTIRSDEKLRNEFPNDAKRWFNRGMPRGLDSLIVEGFLTRHYIPTKGNKMIDGFPGSLIFHQRMRGTTLEFGKENSEELVALGKFKPDYPNYVACFIPYSEKDREEMEIPNFAKAGRIRYTMMRGYTKSKQFYSPDYSHEKPDGAKKDYRRTLLWAPTAKSDSSGSVRVELFNNSSTKYVNIDVQGRGKKSIYGNAANISTREKRDSIGEESSYMRVWKKLSKTELPPTIITRCSNVTREGVAHYALGEYEKAVKSFSEAASYGFAPALANIGKCYFDGKGVGEDKQLGLRYFEMAAEKGNNLAMHNLGDVYHEGKIVAGNDSLAYEYYRKAAENNFAASQRMMGIFHEEGIFVEKDNEKALKWYNLAALQNDPDALYKVGMHIVAQDSIMGLSKRQLRKSQAINYIRKAARGGNVEAQRFIVKCFAEGKYLKKSRKKSFEWMKSIAEVGNEEAMMFVAYCHEKGRGTDVNHPLAYKLYKDLAEKGNEFAIQKVYEFELLRFFMYNSPKPPGVK